MKIADMLEMNNMISQGKNSMKSLISRAEQRGGRTSELEDKVAGWGHSNKSHDKLIRTLEQYFQNTQDTMGRQTLSLMDKGGKEEEYHSKDKENKKIVKI